MRLILALAVLMIPACASLRKPTNAPFVPPAGCSERAPALLPPPPPSGASAKDWEAWRKAYVGALNAYTDSENKRAATADCLDAHRK